MLWLRCSCGDRGALMPRLRSKMAPQFWHEWAPLSRHEHLNPSTATIPPKVTAYFRGWNRISNASFFSPTLSNLGIYVKNTFCQKKWGGDLKCGQSNLPSTGGPPSIWGRVKVNFLARFGQKSDLSGLCGIGYWVWIISPAHCKQPILVGY